MYFLNLRDVSGEWGIIPHPDMPRSERSYADADIRLCCAAAGGVLELQ